MNTEERINELGSRLMLGRLTDAERDELDRRLVESEAARACFGRLCADEMLLWQTLRSGPAGLTPPSVESDAQRVEPPARVRAAWTGRARHAAAAAVVLGAFAAGWLGSRFEQLGALSPRSAHSQIAGEAADAVAPLPIPTPDMVLLPLDYDERGQLRARPYHNNEPLEIANL